MDQGSNMKRSAVHNFAPTVTKFCIMWEGQALPHDTKFGNSRCEIVGRRVIFIWSLIHGLRWSGLIKAEPGHDMVLNRQRVIAWASDDPIKLQSMNFSNLCGIKAEKIWHYTNEWFSFLKNNLVQKGLISVLTAWIFQPTWIQCCFL